MKLRCAQHHLKALVLPILVLLAIISTVRTARAGVREIDNIRVIKELQEMTRSEAIQKISKSDSIWRKLKVLGEYSSDTWYFVSSRKSELQMDQEFLSPNKRKFVQDLRERASLSNGTLQEKVQSRKLELTFGDFENSELQDTVSGAYSKLRKSDRVYAWEMLDRHERIGHLCRDECACIAMELSKTISENHSGINVYSILMHGGDGAFVGVNREIAKGISGVVSYSYHVALLVEVNGVYGIIDPVILGTSTLENPEVWLSKFIMTSPIQVEIFKIKKAP